jgi:hypothetical protein
MRVSENAKTAAAKYVGVKDVVEVAVWGWKGRVLDKNDEQH